MKGIVELFKKRKGGGNDITIIGNDNDYDDDDDDNENEYYNDKDRRRRGMRGRSESRSINRSTHRSTHRKKSPKRKQQQSRKRSQFFRNYYPNENDEQVEEELRRQLSSSSSSSSSSPSSSSSSYSWSSNSDSINKPNKVQVKRRLRGGNRNKRTTGKKWKKTKKKKHIINNDNNKMKKKKKYPLGDADDEYQDDDDDDDGDDDHDEVEEKKMLQVFEGEEYLHEHGGEESSEFLTREELFDIPARELRSKCRALGLDTSQIIEKEGLVMVLYEYYRRQSHEKYHATATNNNHNHNHNTTPWKNNAKTGPTQVRFSPEGRTANVSGLGMMTNANANANADENEQMVEILFEIIPYYGQGDHSIDSIVKDTIERLPFYCLESRDQLGGNTLLMVACQVCAIDLVSMLLSKGGDLNAQNRNGECCLHFVCYNDSYSPDIAEVGFSFA